MKRVLALFCILVASITFFLYTKPDSIATKLQPGEAESKEILYQDILITLLMPQINKAIDNYYSEYLTETPSEAPYFVKILNVRRPNGDRTSYFIIKFEVMPYIGPHNSVGKDHITLAVKYGEEPVVIKFEHIESYTILQNYQHIIKTKWPPEK